MSVKVTKGQICNGTYIQKYMSLGIQMLFSQSAQNDHIYALCCSTILSCLKFYNVGWGLGVLSKEKHCIVQHLARWFNVQLIILLILTVPYN